MNRALKTLALTGVLFYVLNFPFCAKAQFISVPVGAPCPRSSKVDSDTISYAANQPMPFDQCFYLKCVLPGQVTVDNFLIVPVDAEGGLKITHRDYYCYIQNYSTSKERRYQRKTISYKDFKAGKHLTAQASEKVTTIFKKNHTEVTLDVPPLEPAREYKIKLLTTSDKDAQLLLEVGELVFKSQTLPVAAGPAAKTNMLEEAALLYRRNAIGRIQSKDYEFSDIKGFDEFINTLYAFQIHFDAYNTHAAPPTSVSPSVIDAGKPAPVKEYQLFFTALPAVTPTLSALQGLGNSHLPRYSRHYTIPGNVPFVYQYDPAKASRTLVAANIQPRVGPSSQDLFLDIVDTSDNPINVSSDGKYLVQAVAYDTQSPSVPHLLDVGTLTFSKGGTQFLASPAASDYDGKWLEADRSLMGNYALVEDKKKMMSGVVTSQAGIVFNTKALNYCVKNALVCPCEEKGVKDLTLRDQLVNSLVLLNEPDSKRREAIAAGISSIEGLPDVAKTGDYQSRLANLKSSAKSLNTALDFIKKLQALSSDPSMNADLSGLIVSINTYLQGIQSASSYLSAIGDTENESKNVLSKKILGPNIKLAAVGSSSVLNLVSESKLRIMPDFGFIVLFDRRESIGKSLGPTDLAPYLGFNIGLRPMDKNIPWRMIRHKSLRHHLSIMSGLTLKSLAVANRREDFFGKTSLLFGVGYRLNNYLRITTGSVLFKGVDPNPFSDDRPVRASAFVGVSIDLDIKDLFGGISTLFK